MYIDEGIEATIYGPYACKDGRRRVVLVWPHRKSSISYARHLMQVKLGRLLEDHEEVDHKDDDPTNDDINNLQILTKLENIQKSAKLRPAEIYKGICGVCGSAFEKPMHNVRGNLKKGKSGPYCSKSCAGKVGLKAGGRPRKS